MNHRIGNILWPLAAAIISVLLLLGLQGLWQQLYKPNPSPPFNAQNGPISYADAVSHAAPSVVNIYSSKVIIRDENSSTNNPLLQFLYGKKGAPKTERMLSSLGSGVIISERGLVVTNYHVIAGADEVLIALTDGRETKAQLIGADPDSDLALLKIQLDNLPSIQWRDSSTVRVGDVVLAIGNPFNVGQTVTMGIISALGRSQPQLNTYAEFIQTDATINLGNSGGALIDAKGQLIGINSAIFSHTGASEGIGFAIPANLVKEVVQKLLTFGEVVRGWLGVSVTPLTPTLASRLQLPSHENGAFVTGVYRNSPAHYAGVLPGDVIIAINQHNIEHAREGLQLIAQMQPGETVQLLIFRQGKTLPLEAIITERPSRN